MNIPKSKAEGSTALMIDKDARVIDLTHTISEIMPVYPGTEAPRLTPASTYEKDGFKETLLQMSSHTGTHMDAPAHLFAGRTALDTFKASQFVGSALVIDCTELNEGGIITADFALRYGAAAEEADFLLFRTGWERYWGKKEYFGEYPCISPETADFLISTRKKGVGLDTIGIDPIVDKHLHIHRRLLEKNEIVIIENLCNLTELPSGLFTFCALPMKYEDADGAPIRAIAIIDR